MTNEEMELAVERLKNVEQRGDGDGYGTAVMGVYAFEQENLFYADLRLLLSERAELLAAVERMRGALEEADRRLSRPDWTVQRDVARMAIRAALTTGEATASTEQGERG